jgi:hypothetical protein
VTAALELLVADARTRWLDIERLADHHADPDLTGWVEQTTLAMLAVRDRLEQLRGRDLVAELEQQLAAADVDEAAA